MKTCPYCEEEQSALKNHVRLASGNGHGPSGQYPDDFESGSTSTNSTPNTPPDRGGEQHDHGGGPPGNDADDGPAIAFETTDEFEDMVKEIEESAIETGFDQGYQTAESQLEQTTTNEQTNTTSEPANSTSTSVCPDCGQQLVGNSYALSILAEWFNQTSSVRVLKRRKYKKMYRQFEEANPSEVCVNCWVGYA